jgi:hypothetical protein
LTRSEHRRRVERRDYTEGGGRGEVGESGGKGDLVLEEQVGEPGKLRRSVASWDMVVCAGVEDWVRGVSSEPRELGLRILGGAASDKGRASSTSDGLED